MKTSFFVEYGAKRVEEKDIIALAKQQWVDDGNKIKDIETLNLYVKPEEETAYYVINDDYNGKVAL